MLKHSKGITEYIYHLIYPAFTRAVSVNSSQLYKNL